MTVRDLFAGYGVQIFLAEERWAVALTRPDGTNEAFQTYADLPDALEAAHELLMLFADETPLVADTVTTEDARAAFRESLVHHVAGEPLEIPEEVDAPNERDRLRAWFERQMGPE